MFYRFYHSQGNVGLSGKPGPKVSENWHLKTALINIFILTMGQMTMCDVKADTIVTKPQRVFS